MDQVCLNLIWANIMIRLILEKTCRTGGNSKQLSQYNELNIRITSRIMYPLELLKEKK